VQDMAALLASKLPVGEASAVLAHLTGKGSGRARCAANSMRRRAARNPSRCKPSWFWSPIK
jgi:hypothetical protein